MTLQEMGKRYFAPKYLIRAGNNVAANNFLTSTFAETVLTPENFIAITSMDKNERVAITAESNEVSRPFEAADNEGEVHKPIKVKFFIIVGRSENEFLGMSDREIRASKTGQGLGAIDRLGEKLMAEVLLDGRIVSGGRTRDFGRSAENTITLQGNDLWSNAASDIKNQLIQYQRLILKNGGTPQALVLGSAALPQFLDRMKGEINVLNTSIGAEKYGNLPSGATYHGNFVGLDVFGYAGTYSDSQNQQFAYVPSNRALLLPKKVARLVFCRPEHASAKGAVRVYTVYEVDEMEGYGKLGFHSNLLPVLPNPNRTVSLTV